MEDGGEGGRSIVRGRAPGGPDSSRSNCWEGGGEERGGGVFARGRAVGDVCLYVCMYVADKTAPPSVRLGNGIPGRKR